MMVKCLTKHQQRYICYYYHVRKVTITELAEQFSVSRRTIKRVIDWDADVSN